VIRIREVTTYNWLNAIYGMRNSWESWDKSDSRVLPNGRFKMGDNDFELALKLSKAGNSHAKFLRQIFVSMVITAPEYWWREYATYKVGTVENSTSQMHKLGSWFVTVRDFSFDDPDDPFNIETVERVNRLIEAWWAAGKRKPSPEWRKLIQNIPQSYNYLRTCTLNYQVLKNIYHDRKNHRLQEWRDFCAWIETLPYAELITLGPSKPSNIPAIA